jgi:hypothetical protein
MSVKTARRDERVVANGPASLMPPTLDKPRRSPRKVPLETCEKGLRFSPLLRGIDKAAKKVERGQRTLTWPDFFVVLRLKPHLNGISREGTTVPATIVMYKKEAALLAQSGRRLPPFLVISTWEQTSPWPGRPSRCCC